MKSYENVGVNPIQLPAKDGWAAPGEKFSGEYEPALEAFLVKVGALKVSKEKPSPPPVTSFFGVKESE